MIYRKSLIFTHFLISLASTLTIFVSQGKSSSFEASQLYELVVIFASLFISSHFLWEIINILNYNLDKVSRIGIIIATICSKAPSYLFKTSWPLTLNIPLEFSIVFFFLCLFLNTNRKVWIILGMLVASSTLLILSSGFNFLGINSFITLSCFTLVIILFKPFWRIKKSILFSIGPLILSSPLLFLFSIERQGSNPFSSQLYLSSLPILLILNIQKISIHFIDIKHRFISYMLAVSLFGAGLSFLIPQFLVPSTTLTTLLFLGVILMTRDKQFSQASVYISILVTIILLFFR